MKSKLSSRLTIFGLCFFLLGFLSRYYWFLELFANFRVYFLFYFLLMVFISLWKRDKWMIGLNLLLFLGVGLSLLPYFPIRTGVSNKKGLKFLSANVLSSNTQYDKAIDLIREENPDVVYLMEVTSAWERELKVLEKDYAYSHVVSREDNFGVAIYSKHEFANLKVIGEPITKIPSYIADIKFGDEIYHFIGTHPLPPIGQEYFVMRNQQFERLNSLVKEYSGNLLLMGDLNCSSFSSNFSRLTQGTDLKDSRLGFGLQGTWTTKSSILNFAIDHCLVSKDVEILDRRVGDLLDSDHKPVIILVK